VLRFLLADMVFACRYRATRLCVGPVQ